MSVLRRRLICYNFCSYCSLVPEDMLKPTTDGGQLNAKHLRRDKFKDRTYPIMCTAYISSELIRSRKGLGIV